MALTFRDLGMEGCSTQIGMGYGATTSTAEGNIDSSQRYSIFTWGCGWDGRLGHGNTVRQLRPKSIQTLQGHVITQVACCGWHSIAVTGDGGVWTWGSGACGQLGHGDMNDQILPKKVEALENLNIVHVACGYYHTIALTHDGEVYVWGRSEYGQLGLSEHKMEDISAPTKLPLKKRVRYAACGHYHTVIVTESGKIYSFGRGEYGQLGHGDTVEVPTPKRIQSVTSRISHVSCGWGHTTAVTVNGSVLTWGFGGKGQLGHGNTIRQLTPRVVEALKDYNILQVSCGWWHTVALSQDGTVFSWGNGEYGQLGHGSNKDKPLPCPIKRLAGIKFAMFSCGDYSTAALTTDGRVYTWGRGREGQLGHGQTTDENCPRKVEDLPATGISQIACGWGHTIAVSGTRPRSLKSLRRSKRANANDDDGSRCIHAHDDFSLSLPVASRDKENVSQRIRKTPRRADEMDVEMKDLNTPRKRSRRAFGDVDFQTPERGIGQRIPQSGTKEQYKSQIAKLQEDKRRMEERETHMYASVKQSEKSKIEASKLANKLNAELKQKDEELELVKAKYQMLQKRNAHLRGEDIGNLNIAELEELEKIHYEGLRLVSEAKQLALRKQMEEEKNQQLEELKKLRREKEELQEKRMCTICYENEISVLLLPCRHRSMCRGCSRNVQNCPICRADIQERMDVYEG